MEMKTDVPGIYKASEGVLINKDNTALAAYRLRKEKEKRLNHLEQEISSLKSDMEEIKTLLRGLAK